MKNLYFISVSLIFLGACGSSSVELEPVQNEPVQKETPVDLGVSSVQLREYTGAWAGLKYSFSFELPKFKEEKNYGDLYGFTVENGGTVPGYLSITTIKMDSPEQKAHEIADKLHVNIKGEVLGGKRAEVSAEKIGEHEVYVFTDPKGSGITKEYIILAKGEAIVIRTQSQGPEPEAMEKDEAAFKSFIQSVKIL